VSASEGYQLVRRIGFGVSGAVYLADSPFGQVAIRQFSPLSEAGPRDREAARRRFLDAARRASALRHVAILPILDVIDEGEEALAVMEYAPGETLAAAMAVRRLSAAEARVVLDDAAGALAWAHAQGVVHGDFKPANCFLSDGHVRVSDFQISPFALYTPLGPGLAGRAHRYLSPEHLSGAYPVGPRSDQYALGVVAYELYTGHSPYGDGTVDLVGAILERPVAPPRDVAPDLPPPLEGVLLRALSRDPAGRFDSCADFVSALHAAAPGGGLAGRGGLRRWLLVGAAAVLAVGGGVAVRALRPAEPKPPADIVRLDPAPAHQAPAPTPGPARIPPQAPKQAPAPAARPQSQPSTPAPPQRVPERPAAAPMAAPVAVVQRAMASDTSSKYTIEVFSRSHSIPAGSSFSARDTVLGELAHGDLKVLVSGAAAPRGALTVEWVVDGMRMDARPVTLGRPLEYGNEPSTGSYVITLRRDGRPLQTFSFRIAQ
jgi:serine/threonine-protein kinase